MLFLPYRLDHTKHGFPFLTALVISLCLLMYLDQSKSTTTYYEGLEAFCSELSVREVRLLRDAQAKTQALNCYQLFEGIRASESPQTELENLARSAPHMDIFVNPHDSYRYALSEFEGLYRSFEYQVPPLLTGDLAYYPDDKNIGRMFSATLAHGDVMHLLGNLIFFYIFSSAIELLVGTFLFSVFFAVTTVSTSLAYSLVMAGMLRLCRRSDCLVS